MSPTITTSGPAHAGVPAAPSGRQLPSPQPPLHSPTRNRYFYGKLLDDHHLTLEQCYFLEQRRLLNRLAVGCGVLCGLSVRAASDGTSVIIEPGVAIDAFGREIIVPEALAIDPTTVIEDAKSVVTHGPGGANGALTICLCYHECGTEPVPALVAECDIRERCVDSLIRERFSLHAHPGVPSEPAYPAVARLLAYLIARASEFEARLTGSGSGAVATTLAGLRTDPSAVLERFQMTGAMRALPEFHRLFGASANATSDPTLTELVLCCAPSDACVVLATVTPASADHDMLVDEATYTRRIMSNDALQEMLIGLTVVLERCCLERSQDSIKVTGGDKQIGPPSEPLPEPLQVTVTDAQGKPVSGATVTFTAAGGGKLSPGTRKTSANGTALSRWTLGATGAQKATASLPDGASATATAKFKRG